jgi:nucleoside-diphosphate-sugar epimerase
MRVLLLGGTGSIGAPVARELLRSGHEVIALARSASAADKLESCGAKVLYGDLRQPREWVVQLPNLDGIINVAGTFADDEGMTGRELLNQLLPRVSRDAAPTRFIYTGGCWLFGATDGTEATEETPFSPLPAFEWAVEHIDRIRTTAGIWPIVIHPAMVYERSSGVFARNYKEASSGRPVSVVGSEHVRWPLVHNEDLAVLYRMALERASPGESFLGCAIPGLEVGKIARAFARRFRGVEEVPIVLSEKDAVEEFGPWAAGYARDQLQSGAKARRRLGWAPIHVDPLGEIARG